MTLSVSNRSKLAYILESVFGTIPGTGPNTALRFTGESLNFNLKKDYSKEIRSDRQIADLTTVGASATGGVNFELSYREYDPLIEAASQGTWAPYGALGIGTSFAGTFTSTTITAGVAPTTTSAFTTLSKGQWFRLTAPAQLDDGKFYMVSRTVAPTSTVITVDPLTPILGVGSAIAGTLLATSRLTNGVTQRSFDLETQFTDVSQFLAYTGMVVNKMSLSIKPGAFVTGMFDFMGKAGQRGSVTALPGAVTPSQVNAVINGVSGGIKVFEGGAVLANTFMKSFDIDIDNSLRGQEAVGTLGNAGMASGTVKVTGKMELYLADGTYYDKFLNNTATSIVVSVGDGSNGYAITLPAIRYTDCKIDSGAIDQDISCSMTWQAVLDTTTLQTFFIDRFGS